MLAASESTGSFFYTAGAILRFQEHESILQTLDRKVGKLFLAKEAYEPSLDAWNDVPLIFAQDHPEPAAYDKDPEAELKRINGRVLEGSASNTRIEITGHPRLMTTFQLKDGEVEKGINDGKVSISVAFLAKQSDGKLASVQPHHILFFIENGKDLPGDGGAFILNKAETKEDKLALIDRFRAWVAGGLENTETSGDTDMGDTKELEAKLAQATGELADAKLAFTKLKGEFDEAGKAKDKRIGELEAELVAFKSKEKDAKWAVFKAKHVPPGMVEGDKEAKARAEFESDPYSFMEKVLEFKAEEPEGDGAEPMKFTATKAKAREKDVDAELNKLGVNISYKEA